MSYSFAFEENMVRKRSENRINGVKIFKFEEKIKKSSKIFVHVRKFL